MAGVSPAGFARSRFNPWPTPAVPVIDLVSAVRAGAADGDETPRVLAATAGFSMLAGEAAIGVRVAARVGSECDRASGVRLGLSPTRARLVFAAATCVAVLADGARAAGWLRGAPVSAAGCRAIVDSEGRGASLRPLTDA